MRLRYAVMAVMAVMAVAASAQARPPKWISAYPRLLCRTGRNMVTWHDKFAAASEWAQVGMALYDSHTTNSVLHHHLPQFQPYEADPLFGRHPSSSRIYGEGAVLAFHEAAFTQLTHENIDKQSAWEWDIVPLAMSSLHVEHGILNQHICDKVCR